MSAHTPGPWFWEGRNSRSYLCTSKAPEVGYIIVLGWPDGISVSRDERGYADMRLVESAPEMHDALKLALPFVVAVYKEHGREYLPNSADAMERIEALLAKIDGQE